MRWVAPFRAYFDCDGRRHLMLTDMHIAAGVTKPSEGPCYCAERNREPRSEEGK